MTKYKLIKKYPCIHHTWYVGLIVTEKYNVYSPNETGVFCINLCKEHVENFPEFWEKVIELDYEILSFIRKEPSNYAGTVFKLDNGVYTPSFMNSNLSLRHCLTSSGFDIYSVKRLSDNTVFTVGDTIFSNDFKPTKLEKITIRDNGGIAMWGKYHSNMLGEIELASCIIKKPLFTTEDGVDIYESNTYYFISINWKTCYKFIIHEGYAQKGYLCGEQVKDFIYFSSKEKAEEYIIMNKPCLSINDLKTQFNLIGDRSNNELALKELVKSKI